MTNEQWQIIQMADPEISTLVSLLRKKKLSKRKGTTKDPDDLRTMLRHRHNFVMRNKLLYKKVKSSDENVVSMQLVLPKRF